eukprot:Opistho-2@70606
MTNTEHLHTRFQDASATVTWMGLSPVLASMRQRDTDRQAQLQQLPAEHMHTRSTHPCLGLGSITSAGRTPQSRSPSGGAHGYRATATTRLGRLHTYQSAIGLQAHRRASAPAFHRRVSAMTAQGQSTTLARPVHTTAPALRGGPSTLADGALRRRRLITVPRHTGHPVHPLPSDRAFPSKTTAMTALDQSTTLDPPAHIREASLSRDAWIPRECAQRRRGLQTMDMLSRRGEAALQLHHGSRTRKDIRTAPDPHTTAESMDRGPDQALSSLAVLSSARLARDLVQGSTPSWTSVVAVSQWERHTRH